MQVPYTANWFDSRVMGLNLIASILQSRIAVTLAEPIIFRSEARADDPLLRFALAASKNQQLLAGLIYPCVDDDIAARNGHRLRRSNRAKWDGCAGQLFLPNLQRRINNIQVGDEMLSPHNIVKGRSAASANFISGSQNCAHLMLCRSAKVLQAC